MKKPAADPEQPGPAADPAQTTEAGQAQEAGQGIETDQEPDRFIGAGRPGGQPGTAAGEPARQKRPGALPVSMKNREQIRNQIDL